MTIAPPQTTVVADLHTGVMMNRDEDGRPNRSLAAAVDAALAQLPQHGRPELAALLLRCGVPLPVIARVLACDGARRKSPAAP